MLSYGFLLHRVFFFLIKRSRQLFQSWHFHRPFWWKTSRLSRSLYLVRRYGVPKGRRTTTHHRYLKICTSSIPLICLLSSLHARLNNHNMGCLSCFPQRKVNPRFTYSQTQDIQQQSKGLYLWFRRHSSGKSTFMRTISNSRSTVVFNCLRNSHSSSLRNLDPSTWAKLPCSFLTVMIR